MKKLSLILLCFIALESFSQETWKEIKGKVITTTEKGIEEAVPGAKLSWLQNKNSAKSNDAGEFSIKVQKLPDTLMVNLIGFETIYLPIITADKIYTINLSAGVLLDGVEVIAKNTGKYVDLLDPRHVETIGAEELRKAACCNLSESFETNASVDVNLTDAVSGAKKIQMLGLDGVYTQMQWENLPFMRGLSTSYGLSFTPGTWIESIQITKGTGSVVNGYESMAGMINLEMKKPREAEKLYVNMYANRFGRAEFNVHGSQILNKKWSTMSFLHYSNHLLENDVNSDGFRDTPLGYIATGMHRWNFDGKNSEAKFGVKAILSDRTGGQLGGFPTDGISPKWIASFRTEQLELFAKNGYFLKNRKFGSLGLIAQANYQHLETNFGNSTYEGVQKKIYLNTIYGDIIGNTQHNFKTGFSFLYDDYVQSYNDSSFIRTEIVPGAFFEYTYNANDKFILVAGLRGDYHNLFGPLVTPRLHLKWNVTKKSAFRLSAGRGYRVPNPYADFNSSMASNRVWIVDPNIQPEDGINLGLTYSQKFLLFDRAASITADYFYTYFLNQLIVDMDIAPNALYIYATNSTSFAHAFQIEGNIEPIRGLELRAAFKYYNVQAEYNNILSQNVFVPKYRFLLNAGYQTRNKKWAFDATGNRVGKMRLPSMGDNPSIHQRPLISESYWIVNSQITYNFKRFSIYLGGENLLNIIQKDAIISAEDPFGSHFDATQLWAPITGANIYAGLHFAIKHKEK